MFLENAQFSFHLPLFMFFFYFSFVQLKYGIYDAKGIFHRYALWLVQIFLGGLIETFFLSFFRGCWMVCVCIHNNNGEMCVTMCNLCYFNPCLTVNCDHYINCLWYLLEWQWVSMKLCFPLSISRFYSIHVYLCSHIFGMEFFFLLLLFFYFYIVRWK